MLLGGDDGIAPSFIEKPKIIPDETGTLITMKCKCKASPQPTVTWYKEKTTVIRESTRFIIRTVEIEKDIWELILQIKV